MKQEDPVSRRKFCNCLFRNIHNNIAGPQLLFMKDELWFYLSGYKTHRTHAIGILKSTCHLPQPITWPETWCMVYSKHERMKGSVIFSNTGTSEWHVNEILAPHFQELTEEKRVRDAFSKKMCQYTL
jgi:hypothetical protein